jgi:hypothetical protein
MNDKQSFHELANKPYIMQIPQIPGASYELLLMDGWIN